MNLIKVNNVIDNIIETLALLHAPIDVKAIAISRGLEVKAFPLESDVSGLLVIENGIGTIGFNKSESKVRQRFTIAHELGHFELHRFNSNLFIDKNFKIYRSQSSSLTPENQKMEQEANAFAAALLMPESLIIKEVEDIDIDLTNEDSIKELAKKFQVSSIAMQYRIMNLGLLM